jgi:16S rRNA (adenine1518-N6/adenine1519-N6)-dimethyltransferase
LAKTPIPPSPKKKLGQTFLCDHNILLKIVDFIQPAPNDILLEIGAGSGALTALIAPQVSRFVAVELDKDLLPYLENIPNVELIHQDIRQIDLCAIQPDRLIRIIGNLPYYISSNILMWLISHRNCILDMTLMFQEEVAQRILAPPSDSEYGYLSVVAQYFCEIRRGFKIHKNCFVPRPEIESRILHFKNRLEANLPFKELADFLSKAFSQRRKKLRNNLLRTLSIDATKLDAIFKEMGLNENVRAENLSPAEYELLIKKIKEDQEGSIDPS